ncbi:hypothetical protein OOZ15_00430 [Galbibacter sp. EGI 63066]|uniref:toxin-antitoxin system YwqK family antitoxin n=1 Tax=Galbibacter sp. EGI 63066 TaxID=2993559 RepID=UPI00224962F1|nr:hypothetical protein [Galbibacter sp. EGI 63066]MCX2678393.1 hypothetical protein [Galbibacter sp. EGI 63066]
MKLKFLFFAWGTLCALQFSNAQNDTIWYASNWGKTTKDNAAYFRPSPQPKGDGFWVEDYYISGAKQMEGISKKENRDVFDGVIIWYDEDGEINQKASYKDGRLDGEFTTYKNGKETSKLIYKDHKPQNGTSIYYDKTYNFYRHISYKDGEKTKELIYQETPDKGARITQVYNHDANRVVSKYYDKEGIVQGEFSHNLKRPRDQKFYQGTYVNYYYNPMRILGKRSFNDGALEKKRMYYPSSELREDVIIKKGQAHITYYDESGKQLGQLTAEFKPDQKEYDLYRYPINGTVMEFIKSKQTKELHFVKRIMTYENKNKVKKETFYENGELESRIIYGKNKAYSSIIRKETFGENGDLLEEMSYKNGKPYNGTETGSYKRTTTTYKEGVIVAEVKRYKDGSVFKKETGDHAVFYDKKGEVLGKLEYKTETYNYKKPYNGDVIRLNYRDLISSIKSYKEGKRIKNVLFSKNTDEQGKPLKKEEIFYNESGRKTRMKDYYSNGVLKSDTRYKSYADIDMASFYTPQGKELSTIHYNPVKEGTAYTFFSRMDSISSISTYKDNKLVYEKNYDRDYKTKEDGYTIYLRNEIDYNGKAEFYNKKGELLAKATYKEGKPWQGKVVTGGSYQYEIIPYVNGKKHGEQIGYVQSGDKKEYITSKITYKDGQRNGASYYYDNSGKLSGVDNYKDGKQHGEAIDYNEDGSERNKLVYRDGVAYEGLYVKVKRGYGDRPNIINKAYYKEGELVKEERTGEFEGKTQVVKEVVYGDNTLKSTQYDDNGNKISQYHITDIDNESGEVVYYDEKGEKKEIGVLEDGKPVKGVFYLDNFYGKYNLIPKRDDQIKTIKLEINEDKTVLSGLDENDKEAFSIKESKDLTESYLLKEITESSYFYNDLLK